MMASTPASHSRSVRFAIAMAFLASGAGATACRTTPVAPAPSISADTWAVVDGRPIMRDDVEKAFRRSGQAAEALSDEEAMTAKLSLLNELIAQDLLLAKARALKLTLPESELDAAFEAGRKDITGEAFQQELKRRGVTAAEMREGLRRELIAQKVIDQEVVAKIGVTDAEVTEYFNANRAQFNVPEEGYRLAQIVVTPAPGPPQANRTGDDAATPQAAAQKLQMLMGQLKAGASFGNLAMSYSEDPESAPRGGDMGFVPLSRLNSAPASLRDAALKSKPGTATVLSVPGAHMILLVVAHELAGQRDLSMPAVREAITSRLRTNKEQLLRAAYLTAARGDAAVVNHLARRLVEAQGRIPASAPPAAQSGR